MKDGTIAAICVLILILIASVAGGMGYIAGENSVKVGQFEEYKQAVQSRDALQQKLNDLDVVLQQKQKELVEARAKKVIEKVTVYRDHIKNQLTSQCVKESGILDLYDETVK